MEALGELQGPRRLGAYVVGRKLGAGGMATVYAARHQGLHGNRLVALKVLSPTISREDPEHRSFVREAMLAMRLEHPHIVRTYDVGEQGGQMYLAMELVHGPSLAACQKAAGGPVPLPIAMRIVCDVAAALHAAHELEDPERGHLGVVHQDVSPHNVLVGYDGVVKLVDFGVARLATLEGSRTESLRGKPSYVSPEQVHGKNIDRRTDVFALGIVLWELLTGRRLFRRETSAATYIAVLNDPVPDVRDKNPTIPAPIAAVVAGALERDRERRFATTEEVALTLEAACEASFLTLASHDEVARWARQLVPPALTPADLEREIALETAPPLPQQGPSDPAAPTVIHGLVPELDLPGAAPPSSARAPQPPPGPLPEVPALEVPPPSQRGGPPASPRASAPSLAGPRSGPMPVSAARPPLPSGDDFDMEIQRDVSVANMAPAVSSRGSSPSMPSVPSMTGPRSSGAFRAPTASGLELARSRPVARSRASAYEDAPSTALVVGGHVLAAVVFGATAFGLSRIAHAPGGRPLTAMLPGAFDGSSAPESGVVSIFCLVLAVALGWGGLKMRPRSWALVVSAGAMLLTSLAMVTVTLASSGEAGTPPDGVLLLPYLVPLALLALGVGVAGRGARMFADEGVGKKLAAVPIAVIAGALAFLAFEVSRLAAG